MNNNRSTKSRYGLLFCLAVLCIGSCKKELDEHPQITTEDPVVTSVNSMEFKGEIIKIGDFDISDYGFVYGTYGNIDTQTGIRVSMGRDVNTGKYSTVVNGLLDQGFGNTIYVRSYITNSNGTVYGAVKTATLPIPSASSVVPMMGKVGDEITISGQFYTANADEVTVYFADVAAIIKTMDNTKIVVEVPSGIQAGHNNTIEIALQIGQQRYTVNYGFQIQALITDFTPKTGLIGSTVTLVGENLPNSYYGNENLKLYFGDTQANASYYYESPAFFVPANITEASKVYVLLNNVKTELPGEFSLIKPVISSVSTQAALPGQSFEISGSGLYGGGDYYPTVKLGSYTLDMHSIGENQLSVSIPGNVPAGTYPLTVVSGPFTVTATADFKVNGPTASGFSPSNGAINTAVNITGRFLPDTYYDVSFGSTRTSTYSTSTTTLQVYVPHGTPVGKHKVTVHFASGDVTLSGTFEVFGPEITSFSPTSGIPGSVITINGKGFSPDTWSTKVRFGTVEASSITSLTETQIKVLVPSGATAGAMKINVETNGQIVTSKDDFTVKNQ